VDPSQEAEQAARDERLCRLLECILGNAKLETIGLDTQLVRKCLAEYCKRPKRLPSERVPRKPALVRPKPTAAVAPPPPTVAPPPPTVARLEEAKPRLREKMDMEHAMEGPMFGLSPQDIAEARARGVKGEPPGPKVERRDDSESGKSKSSRKPRTKK
jgi:hypothetical protein